MLTKRDVENVIEAAGDEDTLEWHYWRDSGAFNVWRSTDIDWLLQVSHTDNRIAVSHCSTDGFEVVAGRYSDDRLGHAFVTLCILDPAQAFDHLAEQDAATVMESSIEWPE